MKYFPLCLFVLFSLNLSAQIKLNLTQFGTAVFTRPVDLAHCGDSRIFIVEQAGKIWIVDSMGQKSATPFLDIDPQVNSSGNEQGLLGLAFHPQYAQNGYFYVYYTQNNGGDTRVSRFSVSATDPNLADPNSELTILEQDQPYSNHNGGCIKFGPDGYLYIGLGDGGSANDPLSNGQNKQTFLAKILRIDINGAAPYAVPADNPFSNNPAYFPEIWHTGLRNPWRFSFDRATGDMWIGDVGQNNREEIDFQPAGVGGLNYGWKCYEGEQLFSATCGTPTSELTAPVYTYDNNSIGCSVTGGFVYRGTKYPGLVGYYLFADYCSGRFWATRRNADSTFSTQALENLTDSEYSSFGENRDGDLYVLGLQSGKIFEIRELCSAFQISGTVTNETCAGEQNGAIDLQIDNPGGALTIFWNNGQTVEDISSLGAGTYIVVVQDANTCVRRDTFEIANQTPVLDILAIDSVVCQGTTVSISVPTAPAGYQYAWFLNGVAADTTDNPQLALALNASTQIQVQYIGAPCNSNLSALLNFSVQAQGVPVVDVAGDTLSTPFVADTYQWYLNGAAIAGATGSQFVAQETGYYHVVALTACTNISESVLVEVIGVAQPWIVSAFSIFPNPTSGQVTLDLKLKNAGTAVVEVVGAKGDILASKTIQGTAFLEKFDLSAFPTGAYLFKVRLPDGAVIQRRVVR